MKVLPWVVSVIVTMTLLAVRVIAADNTSEGFGKNALLFY